MAGGVFRTLVLGAAKCSPIASLAADSRLAAPLVRRFVAGETLDRAAEVARGLNRQGLAVALDHLGENTTTDEGASVAVSMATVTIDRIWRDSLDAYLSIKLTQLGLDVGEFVVMRCVRSVLAQAKTRKCFVRIDMEGSSYTARTIEVFEQLRRDHDTVGIVIQACLYRSAEDAERLSGIGARIRLCKGAYDEPHHIAFRRKRDTDRNYVRIMENLLRRGTAPAIATHDPAILDRACEFTLRNHISADRFEFQMLYGVRRDLQEQLVRRGYRVRVYVPFGTQWYPYMTRRLAERPANLLSIGSSILRERLGAPREAFARVPLQ